VYGRTGGGGPFLAFEATWKRFDPESKFINPALEEFLAEATRAARP